MAQYNTLNSVNFNFQIEKLKEVSFACQTANLPGMSLGQNIRPTPLIDIPIPGDTLTYDALDITFLVDEQLKNYFEIYNWLKSLGFPKSQNQYKQLMEKQYGLSSTADTYSEATLFVLSNNSNVTFQANFTDCFPVVLSGLNFSATDADIVPFIASTTFLFADFEIVVST